ncbi:MAG TPA: endonuclease/exonuclease/phosphatase family protein [Haliscomenobacter sp.]|uniref:endonuclease/exonuclease/phosphatase family protein n=1 Tax=Haliscomenobacter sp. TaxID=2717303 RepID=UPI002CB9B240|nr:endonuclease/exonuclease/phosphatase family protein [Haliscomenobacter sp.]HOY21317.1 endonuclease/exonuclease/phosphatase family protein [Haliscomenobacter sp.]
MSKKMLPTYKSGGLVLMLVLLVELLSAQALNVMTFNIRYNTTQDGENQWQKRKENLASMLPFYGVDICGMQEALVGQIKDVVSAQPQYAYLGVGRDDGLEKGEFSPILYHKDKFEVLSSATFWLSETPNVPSKGWDANLNRIVTWAKFKDKKSKKVFYFFNTHYDHIGKVARRESSRLLLQKVKEIAGTTPAIITGDFNAVPSDEPITVLVEANNPDKLIDTEGLSLSPHFGPYSTFNGFTVMELEGRHIDYIFVKNPGKWKVLKHATLTNTWAGRFASDHHAVLAVLGW